MERADREAIARLAPLPGFLVGTPLPAAGDVELDTEAAHHMRVRRLGVGEEVRVTDGAGRLGHGTIASLDKRRAAVTLEASFYVAPPPPVHILAPVADRERMLWLAEKAMELGAASWRAVTWRRSRSVSPRGEGEAFRAKVRSRMASALVQSCGAWLPRVEAEVMLERVADVLPTGAALILLDAGGTPLLETAEGHRGEIVVAVGPEGGVEDGEREALVAAGFRLASLGGGVLRFETAGVAALAVLRSVRS